MKYKYFVSYNFSKDNSTGFGNCDSTVDFKISGIADVQKISRSIEKDLDYDQVVINNFILLETEE